MGEVILLVLGVLAIVASVPITAILTAHQRKMTELLNGQRGRALAPNVEHQLTQEVAELRQLVAQQTIALDDLSSMHRRLLERSTDDASLKQRLGN